MVLFIYTASGRILRISAKDDGNTAANGAVKINANPRGAKASTN
jgi:hypothetical protein